MRLVFLYFWFYIPEISLGQLDNSYSTPYYNNLYFYIFFSYNSPSNVYTFLSQINGTNTPSSAILEIVKVLHMSDSNLW